MQVAVGFWGETCVDDALRRREVLLPEMGVDLRVSADLVQVPKEAFLED